MHRREVLENHATFVLVRHDGGGAGGRALGAAHTLKVCTGVGCLRGRAVYPYESLLPQTGSREGQDHAAPGVEERRSAKAHTCELQ